MTVCARIKGVTRDHEWVADLFSLLAVGLLFATIWVAIDYQNPLLEWMSSNVMVHIPMITLAALADMFLILILLNLGSSPSGEEEVGANCFGTFRGRRHGGAGIGIVFQNWISHMEQVNKKHR